MQPKKFYFSHLPNKPCVARFTFLLFIFLLSLSPSIQEVGNSESSHPPWSDEGPNPSAPQTQIQSARPRYETHLAVPLHWSPWWTWPPVSPGTSHHLVQLGWAQSHWIKMYSCWSSPKAGHLKERRRVKWVRRHASTFSMTQGPSNSLGHHYFSRFLKVWAVKTHPICHHVQFPAVSAGLTWWCRLYTMPISPVCYVYIKNHTCTYILKINYYIKE